MNASREEALFALALERPAEERSALLDAMCEGDPALRQRLEAGSRCGTGSVLFAADAVPTGM